MKTLRRQRFGLRGTGDSGGARCSRTVYRRKGQCRSCLTGKSMHLGSVGAETISLAAAVSPSTTQMLGRFAAFAILVAGLGIWLAWLWMVVKAIAGEGGSASFSEFLWQLRAVV